MLIEAAHGAFPGRKSVFTGILFLCKNIHTFFMKSKDHIGYLEFAVASNFSFLRGASHPEELMLQAAS